MVVNPNVLVVNFRLRFDSLHFLVVQKCVLFPLGQIPPIVQQLEFRPITTMDNFRNECHLA